MSNDETLLTLALARRSLQVPRGSMRLQHMSWYEQGGCRQYLSTVEGIMCVEMGANGVRGTEGTLWEGTSMHSPLYARLQHNKGEKL